MRLLLKILLNILKAYNQNDLLCRACVSPNSCIDVRLVPER